jgi:hypothetical protein
MRWLVSLRGHIALAVALTLGASRPSRSDVAFANPADPVLRTLYPKMDPVTGLTPVAEPAVAAGRGTPAVAEGRGCENGFFIAEPRQKEWTPGGRSYLLSLFFVTTNAKPGVPAPCYHPMPWVCVLEKKGEAWSPVDCSQVQQDVTFPDAPSIDTAPFRLNADERAFGVRMTYTTTTRTEETGPEALVLFRLHAGRLQPILSLPIGLASHDYTNGDDCSRAYVLNVETTKTDGFFDWRVTAGKKTGRGNCDVEPSPVGLYRWDGAQYVK